MCSCLPAQSRANFKHAGIFRINPGIFVTNLASMKQVLIIFITIILSLVVSLVIAV